MVKAVFPVQKYYQIILFSILAFSAGFVSKTALEYDQIVNFLRSNATIIIAGVLIFLIGIGLALCGALGLMHRWLTKKTGVTGSMEAHEMITGLVDYVTSPEGIRDPSPPERQRAAIVHLGLWLKRREVTQFYANLVIVTLGGLVGSATLFVLIEQNEKLGVQNELVTIQNTLLTDQNAKIELQTQANIANAILLEGTRRASLSQEMSALFEAIRKEVDEIEKRPNDKRTCADPINPVSCQTITQKGSTDRPIFETRNHLSGTLTKRVINYAEQSMPYHVAQSNGDPLDMSKPLQDQFIFEEYSPERALLLRELLQNNVAQSGADFFINFRYAQLYKANLSEANLRGAYLIEANLSEANLIGANLSDAELSGANLSDAELGGANLSDADLFLAELNGTELWGANLSGANLSGANLSGADLSEADLSGAILDGADLRFAKLTQVEFMRPGLRGATFYETELNGSLFAGAPDKLMLLQETNLQADQSYAAWRFVDFTGVLNLTPSALAHSFGDGTVVLPKSIPRPCHWTAMPLQSTVEDKFALPAADDPYIGRWRGWVEANGGDWPTSPRFEDYKDVAPIAPPENCPLIADF